MKTKGLALFFAAFIVIAAACRSSVPTQPGVVVRNDVEGLMQMINLPARPQSVLWVVSPRGDKNSRLVPGPSDSVLEAVITFSPEDLQTIWATAEAHVQAEGMIWDETDFEDWYPDSLKRSFVYDSGTGKYKFSGPVYDAASIFGKSPYLTGGFIVFNAADGELFLSLSTR